MVGRRDNGGGRGTDAVLPIKHAAELSGEADGEYWLIEGLWGKNSTGILGAEPKVGKTWYALDMAVSVATGTPCLRRFPVREPGPVLYYPAEDAEHILRQRVAAIAATIGTTIDQVPVQFLTAESLRLDLPEGRDLLARAIEAVRPRLVVLDPLVRLHQGDENSASGVGAVLGGLRTLQRRYGVSILLVHHMRKSPGRMRPGQALRGSGDLHAWGDVNFYLAKQDGQLLLTAEHRAAEGFENLRLALIANGDAVALHAQGFDDDGGDSDAPSATSPDKVETTRRAKRDLAADIEALLRERGPLLQRQIREALRARMQRINVMLRQLESESRIARTSEGYVARSVD